MANLLVVDGSLLHRTTVREILLGADHTVHEAADPQVGLVLTIAEAPDVILIGVDSAASLPTELLEHLRAHAPQLPVILLSSQPVCSVAEMPARAVLCRPADPETLLPTVDRLLPAPLGS